MAKGNLSMKAAARKTWAERLDRAKTMRKRREPEWQENIDAYTGKPLTTAREEDWVNVNVDFATTEQKKSALFFQSPDVQLTPTEPLMQGREGAVTLNEQVLNEYLSPDHIDAKRLMDRVLFDVICASGFGATKIGYETRSVTVEQPVMQPAIDPQTGQPQLPQPGQPPPQPQPAIDPETGEIQTQEVEVPVHEEWYWRRISPMKTLIPHDFHNTDFDEAPWLGQQFDMSVSAAKSMGFALPKSFSGTKAVDQRLFDHGDGQLTDATIERRVEGVEVWYRAADFDPIIKDPKRYRQVIFVDGVKEPVVHRDSPYQTVDPTTGRLTPDSMIGNPIHICTIRDLSDSAYPPPDCTITRSQVRELSKFRTQLILQRDRSIPMRGFDVNAVDPDTAEKLRKNEYQSMIPMNGPFRDRIWEIAKAHYPRENFEAQRIIQDDIERAMALGSNQQGAAEDTVRTATEVNAIGAASNLRMEAERNRVISWYLQGVGKLHTLLMRFATQTQYVQVVGQQGAQQMQAWTGKEIAGRFAYRARPDSSLRMDRAVERQQALQLYQLARQDPHANGFELLKNVVSAFGLDTQKATVEQQPESGPTPPNVSLSFTDDSMAPQQPQFEVIREILKQLGLEISQEAVQKAMNLSGVQQNLLASAGAQPEPGAPVAQSGPPQHPGAVAGIGGPQVRPARGQVQ